MQKLLGGVTYALACATVAENLAVVLVSSPDLRPSNDRTGKAGSQEIADGIVSCRWPKDEGRRVKRVERDGADVPS